MLKKVLSLLLCLIMILTALAGCAQKDENDKGAYITMYLTDPVYDFDPAHAYENEAALKIVSLMFDTLFTLDENGKVQKSLVKDYEIDEAEKTMLITLNDTCWSDGNALSANDVVFAWKRLLNVSNSFSAAALLYDIKNAREAKEGSASIDDVGVVAASENKLQIEFVDHVDYDRFLINLTSVALAPLREDVVTQVINSEDWAKKPTIFLASGPFKLKEVSYEKENAGLILERNNYYYRDIEKDDLDKFVTPFRLIVDYTKTPEQIMQSYSDGKIFYVGNIPLSVRGSWKEQAVVTDAMSTHTYVLNEKSVEIFANPEVRKALSMAIDREAIANAVVFAKAATALVPSGVFEQKTEKEIFREVGGNLLSTTAAVEEAKTVLKNAGITPSSEDPFTISVAAYDDVHMKIAEMVEASWKALGFKVSIQAIETIDNTDKDKTTQTTIKGIKDDVFAEQYYAGEFDVAAIDYTAYSADAFSVLAPFAKGYTGNAATSANSIDFTIPTHITGYDNEAYNALIEEAYKATDASTRAAKLHEAEKILMNDLPVIPIVFNQNATLTSKELSKYDFTYYGTPVFHKLKLKNYQDYLPTEE